MKKALLGALIALTAATAVFFALKKDGGKVKYTTAKLEKGSIKASVTATGAVNPVVAILVGTQVSGTMKSIHVDFNSTVKKGELLAEIDPTQFEAQLEQSMANLLNARANMEKAEAALRDAGRSLERAKELFAGRIIPGSELDSSRTNLEYAKAQLNSAKAQVAQMEAVVRYAAINLQNTKIVSPVEGTVISKNVDVGQTVAASFQTPTLFTIARDLKKMQIDANINEADIGRITQGQPVEFTVDAYPDNTFSGEVAQIRMAPTVIQNVVTYDVVAKVENGDLKLKPGMTANVSIITAVKEGVLKAPNAALRFKPQDETEGNPRKPAGMRGGPGLWELEEGKPRRISVKTGITDGAYTEIISGDAMDGMEVITESSAPKQNAGGMFGHRLF